MVIHDELDVAFGAVRLKLGGGDNGHNGLRSITQSLGTRDYYRARFGIGRPPGRMDPAAFVLKDFSAPERKELPFALDRCADAVEALITKGLVEAQNEYHTDPAVGTGVAPRPSRRCRRARDGCGRRCGVGGRWSESVRGRYRAT